MTKTMAMVPSIVILCVNVALLSGLVGSLPLTGRMHQTAVKLNSALGQINRAAQQYPVRRQEIMAVPPVTTSILHGPYLPPADADNQVYLAPHGIPNPVHGHHFYPGAHFPHPNPYSLHLEHSGLSGFYGAHEIPFGYNFHGYHPDIPFGIRHQYHTHWPHMHVAGPVIAGDPNDGMYQEPSTGALIPRLIMPQQYPVMLSPSGNLVGEDGPGVMFLGTGRNVIPVSHSDVENQIIDKYENRHGSTAAEVADEMEREIMEKVQEKQIEQKGVAQKHGVMEALKLRPKQ